MQFEPAAQAVPSLDARIGVPSSRDVAIVVSEFRSLTDVHGIQSRPVSWGQFVDLLTARGVVPAATKSGELWSPAIIAPNREWGNANTLGVSCMVFDLDHATPEQIAGTVGAVLHAGLAFLLHSTWQHDPAVEHRYRLIVPLAQPVPSAQWPAVWAGAIRKFAPWGDVQCKDVSRRYYLPYGRPGKPAVMLSQDGAPLDGNAIAWSAPAAAPPRAVNAVRRLSRDVLQALSSKWRKSKSPAKIDTADRLRRVLDGVAFAAPGERDSAAFALLAAIVGEFPDVETESLLDHFARSLAVMAQENPDGALSVDVLRSKVERARSRALTDASRLATAIPNGQSPEEIAQAFGGRPGEGRSHGYTEAEIADLAAKIGLYPAALQHAWILQKDSDYWLYGHNGYEQSNREGLANKARVVLAPAPIDLYAIDETGKRELKTPARLLEDYSTPLAEIRQSLIAQGSRLDLAGRRLTIATAPRRPLTPAHDPIVAQWLRVLGGARHRAFLAWLSHLTDLSRPTSALLLLGAAGAGKSLLARCLSRVWTSAGPTPLEIAMSPFNAPAARCPLLFGDEKIPRDARGNARTEELRELVQSVERPINEKFRAVVPLDGAWRIVVAANNAAVLNIESHLESADIQAIAERFLPIDVTEESRRYLEGIGGRAYIEANWIEGDAVARHVLSLCENPAPWYGRFGVDHDSGELARRISVRSGWRSLVCEILVRWIMDPSRLSGSSLDVEDGQIVCTPDDIKILWDAVHRRERAPRMGAVASALRGIASGVTETLTTSRFRVSIANLIAWIAETSAIAPQAFAARLLKLGITQ